MLGVGGSLGPPLAGVVVEHYDVHALFWITSVAGIIALVSILATVPEAPGRSGGRIDVVVSALRAPRICAGAAALAAMMILFIPHRREQ